MCCASTESSAARAEPTRWMWPARGSPRGTPMVRSTSGRCCPSCRSLAGGGSIPPDVLTERLILAIFAHGTGSGIRSVAAGSGHHHTENDIRYASSHYLGLEAARQIAIAMRLTVMCQMTKGLEDRVGAEASHQLERV